MAPVSSLILAIAVLGVAPLRAQGPDPVIESFTSGTGPVSASGGRSVSLAGDRLAVGVAYAFPQCAPGRVQLWNWTGNSWQLETTILDPALDDDGGFGSSVSLAEDLLAVGTWGGTALFRRDSATSLWSLETEIPNGYPAGVLSGPNGLDVQVDPVLGDVLAVLHGANSQAPSGSRFEIHRRDPATGVWNLEFAAAGDWAEPFEAFSAVAIDGSRVAYHEPGPGGGILVLSYDPGTATWQPEADLTNSIFTPITTRMGIGLSGDRIAVGDRGVRTLVLELDPTTLFWTVVADLPNPLPPGPNALAPTSLALEGDVLVIDSLHASPCAGTSTERAWVYRRDAAGNWLLEDSLEMTCAFSSFQLGSIALSGDRIAIGDEDWGGTSATGATHTYRRDPATGDWTSSGIVPATSGGARDQYGEPIASAGDLIASSASEDGDFAVIGGSVILHRRDPSTGIVIEEARLRPVEPWTESRFGSSIAVGTDRVAVRSIEHETNSAVITIFEPDPTTGLWEEAGRVSPAMVGSPPSHTFGGTLAFTEDVLVIDDLESAAQWVVARDPATATWTLEGALPPPPAGIGPARLLGTVEDQIWLAADDLATGDPVLVRYRRDSTLPGSSPLSSVPIPSSTDHLASSLASRGSIACLAYTPSGAGPAVAMDLHVFELDPTTGDPVLVQTLAGPETPRVGLAISDEQLLLRGFDLSASDLDAEDLRSYRRLPGSTGFILESTFEDGLIEIGARGGRSLVLFGREAWVADSFRSFPCGGCTCRSGVVRRVDLAAVAALTGTPDCNGNGIPDFDDIVAGTSADADGDGFPDECGSPFLRGDADGSGTLTIGDPIVTLAAVFQGTSTDCVRALDTNDDGAVDLADPIATLAHLFQGGPPPAPPFPACAADATPDPLDCAVSPCP